MQVNLYAFPLQDIFCEFQKCKWPNSNSILRLLYEGVGTARHFLAFSRMTENILAFDVIPELNLITDVLSGA